MSYYVCIDIGGTAIKYGLADEQGTFLDKGSVATEVLAKGAGHIVQTAENIVKQYSKRYSLSGIAVSTAGMVNPDTGEIIYAAAHFPGYTGTRLKEQLEEKCQLPCTVENDVNAAGLGEYWRGAGQGSNSLFCLTVGTGIGGCSILGGQVITGSSFSAGEIGYLRIGEAAGTLEELASVTALIKEVASAKNIPIVDMDGKRVFSMAKAGDTIAIAAIGRMLGRLAQGIANICYVLNPELVIVGGGIMAQTDFIRPRLMENLQQMVLPVVWKNTRLEFARLGNDAGMVGALYNFLQRNK